MNIIKTKVIGDTITPIDKGYVIENQVNQYAIEFEFDETWDFEEKYVIFQDEFEEQTFKRAIINNQVIVPSELLNGRITIQVYGQNIEDNVITNRQPSLKYVFSILNSLPANASEEQNVPTPTQWEIYIEQIETLVDDMCEQFQEVKAQVELNTEDIGNLQNDVSNLQDRATEDESQIQANSTEITNIKRDYSLITETGNKLSVSIDSNYLMTITLKDKNDNILSTASVDFPIESAIVNATYNNSTKEITFTLQNGNTLVVPIGDIISGLASQSDLQVLANRVSTIESDYLKESDKTELQQSIADLAERKIEIGNLDEHQRNILYEKVTQNDVAFNHTTIYNGSEGWDNAAITSPYIYFTKGTILHFYDSVRVRITKYDKNKVYKSNTGSYTTMETYTIPEDDYYRIGLASSSPLEIIDAKTLSQFVGYRKLEEENSTKYLTWQYGSIDNGGKITNATHRMISSLLQVAKGTIIKQCEGYNNFYIYCIDKYDLEGNYISSVQWNHGTNVIEENCLIRLRLAYANARTITNDDLQIIPKFIFVKRTIPEINILNNKLYECSGHRGSFNIGIPENTIFAYKYAKMHNFDSIETDVRMTSNHIPIICHDESINRTARNTNGTTISTTINVADHTFEELDEYDYGIYCGSQYAGTKLLTFDDVVKFAKYYNIKINIDCKVTSNSDIDIIYNILRKYGMQYSTRWTVSTDSVMRYLLSKNGKLEVALGAWTPTVTHVTTLKSVMNDYPNAHIMGDFYVGNMTNAIYEALQENDVELSCYCENNNHIIQAINYGAIALTINNYLPYGLLERTYNNQ